MTVFLDSGVIWELVFHKQTPAVLALKDWFKNLANAGHNLVICEISDYEVRRELIRKHAIKDLEILDDLISEATYAPITTSVMRLAAIIWAEARQAGRPLAEPQALDCDVILLAHIRDFELSNPPAVIATKDVGDLRYFADARLWQDVTP